MDQREPFSEGDLVHLPALASGDDVFRVEMILRGGMGLCAKIKHESSGKLFALKTVLPSLLLAADLTNRFMQEVEIWLRLSACNGVVEAFSVLRHNQIPVVCAKWMQGGNLRLRMFEREPEFILRTLSRIVGTLDWCISTQGVTHRDLKPENILLDANLDAFIGDWGLAGAVEAVGATRVNPPQPSGTSARRLTRPGHFFGTLPYAAPEQLVDASTADHRSDIYSLGCMILEWLNGRVPFTATTLEGSVAEKCAFRSPRGRWLQRSPATLEELANHCLDPDPRRRPQSYRALKEILLRVARSQQATFVPFAPSLRYNVARGGRADLLTQLRAGTIRHATRHGGYSLVEADDLEPYLREAERCLGVGELKTANEIYEMIYAPEPIRSAPDNPLNQRIAVNYASCLVDQGRPRDAISVLGCLDRGIERPSEYFLNLSFAWIRLLEFASAREVAIAGLDEFPSDKHLVGNLLISEAALGEHDKALQTAARRLGLGRDAEALQEVGKLYLEIASRCPESKLPTKLEWLDRAADLLLESRALNPNFNATRLNLARAFFDREDYARCAEELGEYARVPKDRGATLVAVRIMAKCLFRLGVYEKCVEFCDRWLGEFAEDVSLTRSRAEAMVVGFSLGNLNENGRRVVERTSQEFFERIVEDESQREPDDFIRLSQLKEWMDAPEAAVTLLERALALYPEDWTVLFHLGKSHRLQGRNAAAYEVFNKSAEIAPWRSSVWSMIAEVCPVLGREGEAKAASDREAATKQLPGRANR